METSPPSRRETALRVSCSAGPASGAGHRCACHWCRFDIYTIDCCRGPASVPRGAGPRHQSAPQAPFYSHASFRHAFQRAQELHTTSFCTPCLHAECSVSHFRLPRNRTKLVEHADEVNCRSAHYFRVRMKRYDTFYCVLPRSCACKCKLSFILVRPGRQCDRDSRMD